MTARNSRPLIWIIALMAVMAFLSASAGDALAGKWKDASKRHENACKAWCAEREECHHCSTLRNCGQGYDNMHSWTGYGKNWHACKKRPSYRQAGNQNHSECIEWCDNNKPRCDKCSTSAGCGAGYKSIKMFGGRGDNYYACERRAHTEARRNECQEWCSNQGDYFVSNQTAVSWPADQELWVRM